ncbi:hypothetical protein Vretifemale_1669 [Volvox reticuliferus]|uniref:starch synthase n=1 Tax=Volvox reticuliferus TaxID=1737510 RepID=A0A8J4FE07_9CHLO|nr:hypothetical protein Vretifemale_1669 [Volvox reticuliferus]
MNTNCLPATSSARELRRTVGPSGCARRAARNVSHQSFFLNSFQQKQRPAVTSDLGPEPLASSGKPSSVSQPPEEDFLHRVRKMQRRIAKLKRLQERLTQIKEEEGFQQAYAEALAADPDSDSDADDGDLSTASTPSTLVGSPPRLPVPSPSASADELRQWVAAVVAQSAARAGSLKATARTGSSSDSNNRSTSTSNQTGLSGIRGHEGREVGTSPPAAYPPPPSTSQQPLRPALTPTEGHTSATAPPGGAGSSSNINNRGGSSRGATASVSGFIDTANQACVGGRTEGEGGGGGLRRYTVRYPTATSQPVFVQMPPAGAQSGSSFSPDTCAPAGGPLLGSLSASAASAAASAAAASAASASAASAASASAASVAPPAPTAGSVPAAAAAPSTQPQKQSISPPGPPPSSQSASASETASADRSSPSTTSEWRRAATPAAIVPPPQEPRPAPPPQAPLPQQQLTSPLPAACAATDNKDAPFPQPVPADVPSPPRDPNAELRATVFPESLTCTNPYTLYDMPLPPLPLRESWRTAAERRAEAVIAGAAATPAAPPLGGATAGQVREAERPRDLVFVTAEVAPWSKTGGLGDVMGALPRALAARGHRVMVVSPRYLSPSTSDRYKGLTDTGVRASLDLGPRRQGEGGVHQVGYFHTHKDDVDWVFVDHISYHREGTPYGNAHETYGDNLFRFSLLCLAACEAPLLLNIGGHRRGTPPGLPYGQDVTFIANDWHAGLVPVYVAAKYRKHGVFKTARCVLALHNLAHQGAHPPHCFGSLGLPGEWYGALEWIQTPGAGATQGAGGPDHIPTINILKAALVTSDRLVTVSPAYAWEITAGLKISGTADGGADGMSREVQRRGVSGNGGATGRGRCDREDHGMGLGSLLRQRAADLSGIVNGIDTSEWDPRTDPYLPRNYHEGSLGGKGLCKAALQGALNLPVDPAAPMVGFIGRLDYQKGPDLVLQALPKLVAAGCQVILLGSGAPDYEEAFRAAAVAFPANVRAHVGFSVPLSHRILAAADILLMPSRFEPCGLNQLYAMRYGTVPVAHGTGGLRDTIDDVKPFLGEAEREGLEDLDELFATGLAWGRRTASRSADDPSTNNTYYQDYSGSSARYGPADEDDDMYGVDQYNDDDDEVPAWRRGLPRLNRNHDPGTGWTFAPACCEALLDAVTAALAVYEHYPDKWRRIQIAGMRRDFSWGRAARRWEAVMEDVHAGAPYCK